MNTIAPLQSPVDLTMPATEGTELGKDSFFAPMFRTALEKATQTSAASDASSSSEKNLALNQKVAILDNSENIQEEGLLSETLAMFMLFSNLSTTQQNTPEINGETGDLTSVTVTNMSPQALDIFQSILSQDSMVMANASENASAQISLASLTVENGNQQNFTEYSTVEKNLTTATTVSLTPQGNQTPSTATSAQASNQTITLAPGDTISIVRTQQSMHQDSIQNSSLSTATISSTTQGESIFASVTNLASEVTTDTATQNAPSPRQNTTQQVMTVNIQELAEMEGNAEGTDTESTGNETSSESSSQAMTKEGSSFFNQSPAGTFSSQFSSLTSIASSAAASPTASTLAFGSEESILQQIQQTFHTNQIAADSKITLKLHPAQLGELKIDIQIKEGTVHASILAQSHRVQEILEKNMTKLKSLMEENGLVVNDITVKVESEISNEFNLFNEEFSNNGTEMGNNTPSFSAHSSYDLEQEAAMEIEEQQAAANQGFNVTI